MVWGVIDMFQLRVTLEQIVKAMYTLPHSVSFPVSASGRCFVIAKLDQSDEKSSTLGVFKRQLFSLIEGV